MDTRLILQIVLGIIVALILVMGVVLLFAFLQDADTVVVDQVAEEEVDEEQESPWAGQGDAAIAVVQRQEVESDPDVDVGDEATIGELIESEEFVEKTLNLTAVEPDGWDVEWWGETRFGPSYYLVRYNFVDENVVIGPAWLVELRSQKVVPKNVLAEVTTDPEAGVDSEYYDQAQQVVSAMINHRFPTGLNLGGALLLYFEDHVDTADEDEVLGWTVDHSRQQLFEAYFQWTVDGEPVYATFEFDFEEHALRPANLQANEIMRVGEDFGAVDRVSIMPAMYDPDEPVASRRWQGPARNQCRQRAHRDGCEALATILDESELIETLEWTLTTHADSADAFADCQEVQEGQRRPECRWEPNEHDERDDVYRVEYLYDIGEGEQTIAWNVDLDAERIEPLDPISEVAYRAVRPRS